MIIRDDIEVGVATHTGPVRGANEDDFVVLEPTELAQLQQRGRLFVIADGMGGVAGGAEASRIAVRGLTGSFLQDEAGTLVERMSKGFDAAAREVHRASLSSPQLADMGTTMTAIGYHGGLLVVGHVGDSRCVRLRDGAFEQLTEDHAVEEPRHLLTRCVGAGRDSEEVDIQELRPEPGDTFALLTDGVWGRLDDDALATLLRMSSVQTAAERLVADAIEAGGTDNATAVVVRIAHVGDFGSPREVDLPTEESSLRLAARELVVRPPRWPWVLLALSSLIAAFAGAKLLFGWSVTDLLP